MRRDGILLLGGGGFIGGAVARRLAADGRQVHVVCRTPATTATPGVACHHGDLDDAVLLAVLLPACRTVIHLASASTPGSSARHAARELDNLRPVLHLLDILRAWPDTHLIFLSSGGTVYGNPAVNPVAEDAALAPLSYHGAGKVALESFLNAYRTTGHPVTVLRPSNTYGPGQTLRHGFGLVRTILQHVMAGTQIEVWGDGQSVRDYLYIDDMVEAVVKAIDMNHPDRAGGTYNIGSGSGHSINAVLDLVARIVDVPLQVHYRPARGIDVREVVLDIDRAAHALQWRPQVQLAEGIARTWRHLQENR